MKKKNYLARTMSLVLAGIMLMTGCGSSASTGSDSGSAATSAGGASETYAPAADAGGYGSTASEAASSDADFEYEAAADDAYDGITNGIKEMDSQSASSYADTIYDYEWEPDYPNTEEYSQWEEQGFNSVMKAPLSTFAADVDTASYSNLRRLINSGYELDELPQGAVRIEEMINYFSYDYNAPKGMEPFGVTTQISTCPWNDDAKLLMIGLKTEDIDYFQAPPSNLVFLLDVSGSMYSYDKLPLLQESFGPLAENLTKKDRVSIVTYAGDDRIVLDGVRGDETGKIKKALDSLEAGGGTYGSKGIETAYELAEENYIKGGNNRIILATDGDLNIGLTSEEELEELITEKKESGIFLSVLGFGTGNIKDNKMETLADKGNGNYAYIDSLREANKVLVEEMTATLLTICKDVKFQVEFNPEVVDSYRLLGYENRALAKEDFNDDTKDAGEIGAGHTVTALYEIILTDANYDLALNDIDDLKYSQQYKAMLAKQQGLTLLEMKDVANWEDIGNVEWLTISIRYKKPAEDESNLLQYPVGSECYTNTPDDDFIFAAAVAEFGLLASHSEYPENASLKHVEKVLKSIKLTDEYRAEFLELVQTVQ